MKSLAELVKGDRVHGSVYLDPEIFAKELQAIFEQGWVYVGYDGEIPDPGDFRLRRIGTQPVIFVRDDTGVVRVLMNRCTHRGNAVCNLERGNAKAFTCAYHGWRFRLDGNLAAVPYADRYGSKFNREDLGLRRAARVESYRGFVFASMSPAGASLTEHLGSGAMAEIDDLLDMSPESELDVRAGVHKLHYRGNWKFQLENSVDGYHANFVHRSHFDNVLARTGFDARPLATSSSPARIRDLGNGHSSWDISALTRKDPVNKSAQSTLRDSCRAYADSLIARHGAERAQYLLSKGTVHLMVFPNLVFIGSHIRVVQPISVDLTEVYLYPTLLKGAPAEVNTRRLRVHETFYGPCGAGSPDDLEIFARNQIGLAAQVDPWVLLSRGLGQETLDASGVITGQMTDELPQRALWRRWTSLMRCAPEWPSAPAIFVGAHAP